MEELTKEEKKEIKEEKKEARQDRIKMFSVIKSILYAIVLIIIILFIISKCSPKEGKIGSAHTLIKIEGINELHLAKYKWRGIAAYYKDETKEKVDTNIRYEAEVRAKMNAEKINENITIDDNNKKIIVILPKIEFDTAINIKQDASNISFIPKNSGIEMDEILKTCKNDVEQKIQEKSKMLDTAKDSAKETIQSFLQPLLDENYTIEWKDGE